MGSSYDLGIPTSISMHFWLGSILTMDPSASHRFERANPQVVVLCVMGRHVQPLKPALLDF